MKKAFLKYISMFMSGRYRECLNYPVMLILMVLTLCLIAGYFVQDFRFDASEDTLMKEGDPDLEYFKEVNDNFDQTGFLVLTYMPKSGDLISRDRIQDLKDLENRLEQVDGVVKVDSILDAPLLKSPPVPLSEMASGYRTLLSPDVDLELAEKELTESPLFKNLLISEDGRATAMRINLEGNPELASLKDKRDRLRNLDDPSQQQENELESVESEYRQLYAQSLEERDRRLEAIRSIRDQLGGDVVAHLGGVPMIAADMINYVKRDVITFGALVIALVSIMLWVIFRRVRWVIIPLLSTGVTVFLTMGILGFLKQPVTVISSNFVSLLAIITISFSIHLIARYREIRSENPDLRQVDLVFQSMRDKLAPCVYTALTTVVAFSSLVTSDIVPVMDFGWIMSLGIMVSFFVTYSFFAGLLLLLPKGKAATTLHHEPPLTRLLSNLAIRRTGLVLMAMLVSFVAATFGISRLSLDNRFVEYFRADTEIHQGLEFIDENLGGTMPMDIIVNFEPYEEPDLDESSDFFTEQEDEYPERYWYTPDKIQYLKDFHDYLETKPAVGKIVSLSSLEQVARGFNDGKPLDAVALVAVLSAMPEDVRNQMIEPYSSPRTGMMRISTRLHESGVNYDLNRLIDDIETHATKELGFAPEDVRVTGMAVLFNGMLEHLFESQRSTLVYVILATLLMFLLLLRSPRLAIVGLIPNVLAAATALGFMGFVGIPLDVMTITIAAIIIGIGVDDAIHYLHRFQIEYEDSDCAKTAIARSHGSIGNAIYYTSITVIIGFSVLGFSSFMPTVYFGLMTALAMILALLANLAILPSLLVVAYYWKDKKRAEIAPC